MARLCRLRAAQQFFATVASGSLPQPWHLDSPESDTSPELGLVVRTDFVDEPSWAAFCARLRDSERDLAAGDDDADEPSSDDDDDPPAIFHIINPSSPQDRELLADISNLTALRLFNDVDIRPSPPLPHDARPIDPPNRLVDYRGWQEFYRGKNIWIYDTKSNMDQSVRVVCQSGDMYGTATGDSWRARVSHICQLQLNLSFGAIKIDFGGLDRWDFNERRRNMIEAEADCCILFDSIDRSHLFRVPS